MEYWSDGVMEYWSDGVMEYWNVGALENHCNDVDDFWYYECGD